MFEKSFRRPGSVVEPGNRWYDHKLRYQMIIFRGFGISAQRTLNYAARMKRAGVARS